MPLVPLEHSFQASLQSKMTTSLDGQPASGHEKPQQLYLLGFACNLSSQGMNIQVEGSRRASGLTTQAIDVTSCSKCLASSSLRKGSTTSPTSSDRQELTLTSIGPTVQIRKYRHVCTEHETLLMGTSQGMQGRDLCAACAVSKSSVPRCWAQCNSWGHS